MNSSSFSSQAQQQQSGDFFLSDRFYLTQRRSAAVISSRLFYLLPMAMLAITSVGAQADELDTFQFRVGENIMHQSNVFYLPDSANPQGDKVAVTSAGLKINKAYGLQQIELDVGAENYRYSRFSQLNFTAMNYAAAFRWSITPAFHGNVIANRREFVDSSADVQNTGQVNRRTDRFNALDAEYELGAAWRLVGGVFERRISNSQPFTFEGNSKIQGTEAGLRYVYPSGTSLAYRYKQGKGDYQDRPLSAQFANQFKDREHEFKLGIAPTGKTTIQARLSHLQRRHEGLPARDFSGLTGQLDATWAVTGKTTIAGGVVHELGSYQDQTASYYEGDRFFVSPTWKPTEKTAVRLRYDHGKRKFRGALPGVAGIDRTDTTNLSSITLEWQALRALKLAAMAQQQNRRSSAPGFDYKNTSVGISALFSF